jgi:predicted nucleic-acid-binding protein
LIGVDTNLLLRFVLRDDPAQYERARAVMAARTEADPACVCAVVLAEFFWTLRRLRRVSKAETLSFGRALLATRAVHLPDAAALFRALDRYEAGPADLVDYLIGELNAAAGAERTLTFDARAAGSPPFAPVP